MSGNTVTQTDREKVEQLVANGGQIRPCGLQWTFAGTLGHRKRHEEPKKRCPAGHERETSDGECVKCAERNRIGKF